MRRGSGRGRWLREFGTEIRWTVVVLVAAVLLAVALWPRDSDGPAAGDERAGTRAPATGSARGQADPQRLAELRDRAQLRPCPEQATDQATKGAAAGDSRLAGASGTCLADGKPVDLAAATAGRATLINVWASWCPPCREELPALQAYAEQPGAVHVLGVQVQSSPASGLRLLDELGVHLPTVHDTDRRISAALKVPGVLPASYVRTPSGELRRLPPEVFESAAEVRAAVDEALGGSS